MAFDLVRRMSGLSVYVGSYRTCYNNRAVRSSKPGWMVQHDGDKRRTHCQTIMGTQSLRTLVDHYHIIDNSCLAIKCKRIVTVRELARSQGFPDSFVFHTANGDSDVKTVSRLRGRLRSIILMTL